MSSVLNPSTQSSTLCQVKGLIVHCEFCYEQCTKAETEARIWIWIWAWLKTQIQREVTMYSRVICTLKLPSGDTELAINLHCLSKRTSHSIETTQKFSWDSAEIFTQKMHLIPRLDHVQLESDGYLKFISVRIDWLWAVFASKDSVMYSRCEPHVLPEHSLAFIFPLFSFLFSEFTITIIGRKNNTSTALSSEVFTKWPTTRNCLVILNVSHHTFKTTWLNHKICDLKSLR